MEEEDNVIVKWAQEDVETSYNLLNNNNYNFIFGYLTVALRTNKRMLASKNLQPVARPTASSITAPT